MTYQAALAEAAWMDGSVATCLSNTTQFPFPRNFFSLGDSYSAGIGASCGWIKDEFDAGGNCLKCHGAYPYQIIEIANASNCMEVYHIGCTGASMMDVIDVGWDGRSSQLDLLGLAPNESGWGTISIGGNDVGFAAIVRNCIMLDGSGCEAALNLTEHLISNPDFVTSLTTTYLGALGAASYSKFKLIVTSYAQFFNAQTELCDTKFLWRGKYLTRELRARINKMVTDLNVIIQIAVAIVQMQLVFSNSQRMIFYEDWDALFAGHRFCEEVPQVWSDSWFFTINGADKLPNQTITSSRTNVLPGEAVVDLQSLNFECGGKSKANLTEHILCQYAQGLLEAKEPQDNISTLAYPSFVMKAMHPKSIAHYELAKMIYKHWTEGEYF